MWLSNVIVKRLAPKILISKRSNNRKFNSTTWGPRLLCHKDCDSMDGNRHKATAQRMPSGRKQDWGDQPLFDHSDLYVIPEALIYEIFGGILSSTPSSSEWADCLVRFSSS